MQFKYFAHTGAVVFKELKKALVPPHSLGEAGVPPEMGKGTLALSKSKNCGCLYCWKRVQVMDKGWAAKGKGGHANVVLPAVLCESGLMGTRRMRFCTPEDTAPPPWGASSQEPLPELVWHPGPALEWAQT